MVAFATGQVNLVYTALVANKVSHQHIGYAGQVLYLIAKLKIEMVSSRAKFDQAVVVCDDLVFIEVNRRIADTWLLFLSTKACEPIHSVVRTVARGEEIA